MALLRHLALRCRDVETSRRFYETIGFEFVGYRPSGISMDLSDGTVNITLLPHGEKERPHLEEGEEYIHFGIYVEDFEAVWQRLHNLDTTMEKTVKGRDAVSLRALTAFLPRIGSSHSMSSIFCLVTQSIRSCQVSLSLPA